MVVSLGGVTLNVTETPQKYESDIIRTKIAASARTNNKNNGLKNFKWQLTGWVNNETDRDAIAALVGQSGLTFVDKYGNSFTVSITLWDPIDKTHDHINYTLGLEEDS